MMSRKVKERVLFAVESDEDSVATESTAESEQLEEYGVERILSETLDEEGTTHYLIKWEGYPLCRSDWEPADNILDPVIIQQWEEEKRKHRRGLVELFDPDVWQAEVERVEEEKKDRRRRRKAKRRRRGLSVSPDVEKNEDEEEDDANPKGGPFVEKRTRGPEDQVATTPRKRVKQPEVQRKGVAKKVTPGRRTMRAASTSSSEGEVSPAKSSSGDSLLEELAANFKSSRTKQLPRRPAREKSAYKEDSEDEDSVDESEDELMRKNPTVKPTKRPPPTDSAPAKAAPTKALPKRAAPTFPQETIASASVSGMSVSEASTKATSSAPKAKHTRQPVNVLGNWDADKSRKHRPRVSGATPKDSAEPKFRDLATQNRFQKYSRNEPAPDLSALNMIYPNTGKKLSSTNATEDGNVGAIHKTYNRRTPPPPPPAEKPADPPVPEPVRAKPVEPPIPVPAGKPNPPSARPEKWETCWYWTQGLCRYSEDTCRRAHRYTGQAPVGKQLTCYYWKTRGHCNKREENCQHAHHDTGNVAPKPPDTFVSADIDAPPAAHPEPTVPKSPTLMAVDWNPRSIRHIPKRDITCYYWPNCKKPDDVCEFAHRDTGNYTGQPGTFRRGQTGSGSVSNPNMVPVAIRDHVSQRTAHNPDATITDRTDPAWKLQTAVQTARPGLGSPMQLTESPVHMPDASPCEQVAQTPQWNILGAAMNRRASAPNFSMKATLKSESELVEVKIDVEDVAAFRRLAGSDPILRIEQMVAASDFEHMLWSGGLQNNTCSTGGIFVDGSQPASLDNIIKVCKTNVAGVIATPEGRQSKMLIYPSNAEELRFFDHERGLSSECVLRFKMFEKLPDQPTDGPMPEPTAVDGRPPPQIVGEDLIKLDSEVLFPTKELRKYPVRAVFLMMPPNHQVELEVFIHYFAGLKCKVYHSGEPGQWEYFRKTYSSSCALVVHPDVPLWQIPDLYAFLSSTGGGVRMFSIGVNKTVALLEDREPEFGCERLFPLGSVIFITDDTFINDPESATEIINTFVESHRSKPKGGETSRIAARPGIMDWLLKLAVQNTSERGRQDHRWMKLYSSMCKLARLDITEEDLEIDPDALDNPLFLVSLSAELLPALDGHREGGDEVAATDLAVDWFAGWSLLHASRFRKFVICHEPRSGGDEDMNGEKPERDPRGWGRKYQHLGVVPPKAVLPMVKKK